MVAWKEAACHEKVGIIRGQSTSETRRILYVGRKGRWRGVEEEEMMAVVG
jgi:hypothetical protein